MRVLLTAILFFICSSASATTCWISEYAQLATDELGRTVMAPKEPSLASQSVTTITVTENSAVFDDRTMFIRIFCDIQVFYKVGTSPTATTSTDYLPADKFMIVGVPRKTAAQSWRIALCDADCS